MYPLDKSLFPSNLTPIYAQMTAAGANAIARLNFQATGLDVNYYANCVATDDTNNNDPLPGGGCYVKMPLTLTQLFIATSEKQDIKMTARVFSSGSAPVESQSINVAWANVGLSGGIYYWSTIPNPPKATQENAPATPPNYILLDPTATSGTAIYRYDFTNGTPAPTVTWTDDGGPKSTPPYQGAPAAVNNNVGKGHCIGCHAISNDGKYMALTIGGSASDAANTAILDIGAAEPDQHQPDRQHRSEQLADRQLQRLLEEVPRRGGRRREHLGPEQRPHGQHVPVEALPDGGHHHAARPAP